MALHPWRITWNIIMEVWKIIFLSKLVICRFHVDLPGCKFLMAKAKLALTNKQSATMICLLLCLMGNCWISCGARSDCVAWNCTSPPGYIKYSQPTGPNPREHTKSYRNHLGICRGWHGRVTLKTDPKKNTWWKRTNGFFNELYDKDRMFSEHLETSSFTFLSSTWDLHKASFLMNHLTLIKPK